MTSEPATLVVRVYYKGWVNYAEWEQAYLGGSGSRLPLTEAGPAVSQLDSDNDGIPDMIEYFLGRDPDTNDRLANYDGDYYKVSCAQNELKLTFHKSRYAFGFTHRVEWSGTMQPGSWTADGVTETVADDMAADFQVIEASVPLAPGILKFLRLCVEGQ